jgi:hypothetical protein
MPDFEARCAATFRLRKRGFKGHIGTICYFSEEQTALESSGANFIIHPLTQAGSYLAKKMFFA